MSKKRPIANSWNRGAVSGNPKTEPDYWLARLFKNTFTYRGRRREVMGWSIKIQHRRVRKTLSLNSATRREAAFEACQIYRKIVASDWSAVWPRGAASRSADQAKTIAATPPEARLNAGYWKPRLILRKYTELLRAGAERDWSVRIEHGGTGWYFPLQTQDADQAAAKAAQIYRTLTLHGWERAKLLFPREMTVSIFWSTNPTACTYTTLFSLPPDQPIVPPPIVDPGKEKTVFIVVETDEGVRRSLATWLSRQSGSPGTVRFAEPKSALAAVTRKEAVLALVNRDLAEPPAGELMAKLARLRPGLPAYSYGVYEDSDQIFISLSGVRAGYMFRRRPPTELLEPLAQVFERPGIPVGLADQRIRKYFQSFFDFSGNEDQRVEMPLLTRREQDILEFLSKGFQNKDIAGRLGISAWTVHSHLQTIFGKLGVHSRTGAVVKYLHK